jgi:hypothetical protein
MSQIAQDYSRKYLPAEVRSRLLSQLKLAGPAPSSSQV